MAAPDRIRLTGSLRKRPRKGPLLFARASEDRRLANLRPGVLHPGEALFPPSGEQVLRLGIARTVGVVEEQVSARAHLLTRGMEAVHSGQFRGLEEVDDDEVECGVRETRDLPREVLNRPKPEVDVQQTRSR